MRNEQCLPFSLSLAVKLPLRRLEKHVRYVEVKDQVQGGRSLSETERTQDLCSDGSVKMKGWELAGALALLLW